MRNGKHGKVSVDAPIISVIMLVHNREKLVPRAIESILNQDFDSYEFIIIDNASRDKSGSICECYAQKFKHVTVHHRSDNHIGAGRNLGLSLARGSYVTFVDDDDEASPKMLSFLYGLIQMHDADISICGSSKIVNGRLDNNCVFDDILVMDNVESVIELLKRKKINAGMPTKLIKKRLFDKHKFSESGQFDDITVTYKLFAAANKVVACGKPMYTVLRHEGNNSRCTTHDAHINPNQLEEYIRAYRERTDYLSSMFPEIVGYVKYTEWSYMISMCNKIISNQLTECSAQLNHFRNELELNYKTFYNSPFIEDFEKKYMDKYIRSERTWRE